MKVSTHARQAAHGGLHLSVFLGLVVSCFVLAWTTPARAGSTAVTTCGQVLRTAGDYELAQDVGPCQGDGVVIAANGEHLTLAGHTIAGVNPPSVCNFRTTGATQAGVRAEGPFTDLLINGGTITGFVQGIRLVGLPTAPLAFTVTAMTVTDSCELGIAVHFAQDGLIATSVVTGNGLDGIGLVGAGVGVLQNITIEDNHVSGNARYGILDEGNNINIRDNIVNDNAALFTGAGIAVFRNDNTINRNAINNTNVPPGAVGAPGIILASGVQNNVVTGNTANGNVTGIDIERNASSNTIKGNIAHGNSSADMQDANPACDANTWKANNFDTALVAGVAVGNAGCIY